MVWRSLRCRFPRYRKFHVRYLCPLFTRGMARADPGKFRRRGESVAGQGSAFQRGTQATAGNALSGGAAAHSAPHLRADREIAVIEFSARRISPVAPVALRA